MPSASRASTSGQKHAAISAPLGSGWQSLRSKRLKRAPRAGAGDDDEGLPLTVEILLFVFSFFLGTADLVRCAATCRMWRKLVSSEAEFICRSTPRSDRFVRPLAVGFFHQKHNENASAAPRFVSLAPCFRLAYLDALFDDEQFKSSRLIASRKGRLVFELCRVSRAAVLRLAVCNPMTGEVSILPTLSGKDKPGRYACAFLTADDFQHANNPVRSGSAFQLVLVYKRRSFLACRSYSSDTNSWGPEGKVTGAKISGKRLHEMSGAVVVRGAVFWRTRYVVFGFRVDTLEAKLENIPWTKQPCFCLGHAMENRILAAWPDGRLCAVEVERPGSLPRDVTIRLLFRDHGCGDDVLSGGWDSVQDETIQLGPFLPDGVRVVCLRGLCEKSGVVFFVAGLYPGAQQRAIYALDLAKKEVQLVPAIPGDVDSYQCLPEESCQSFFGYEMDMVAYLKSLGEGEGDAIKEEDMHSCAT